MFMDGSKDSLVIRRHVDSLVIRSVSRTRHRLWYRLPRSVPTACLARAAAVLLLTLVPAVVSGQGTVADDRAALEALYDATNGANWSSNDNWKTDEPLGQWYGVRTNPDGRVTRLELSRNQLSGTIPAELGSLTRLQDLVLDVNQLSGTIPAELGNLTSLTSLFLGANQLSGTIPVELGNLTRLEHLLLGFNQLSGTIPVEIGNLTRLISLDLQDNQLSGTIPAGIGNLPRLTALSLSDNQLSGTIPAELGNLTHLAYLSVDIDTGLCLAPDFDLTSPFATATGLPVCSGTPTPNDPADDRAALEALYDATNGANWYSNDNWKTDEPLGQWFGVRINNSDGRVTRLDLSYNQLSGTIPAAIGNLSSLTELELGGNQLSGTIPVELGNLTRLTTLDLNYNQLSGTIPAKLGNLTRLTTLRLDDNQLSGTIPVELGNLTRLTWLELADNQLSGTIPAELGNLTSLTWLELADNQLSGTIPAELGNLTRLLVLSVDTDTGLCLAPDFDLTSPFATKTGLPVCSTEPSGTPTPKDPAVIQMAVDDAIGAATNGEGLRTGGAPVTVRLAALFTFPSSATSAVTYAGTTFSVSSTAPGVVSVSTTDVGPGVVLTPGADAGTAAVTIDARPEGQPAATPVASVMFEVEVTTPEPEPVPATLTLSADPAAAEGGEPVTVTAMLDNPAPADGTTVTLTTGGTATLDTDYTLSSSTMTIAEGETAGTVTITVTDDAEDDDGETIVLDAESTNPALTAEPLTLTIEDNDVTPVPALPLRGVLLLGLLLTLLGAVRMRMRTEIARG